jgi:hypothetical protein
MPEMERSSYPNPQAPKQVVGLYRGRPPAAMRCWLLILASLALADKERKERTSRCSESGTAHLAAGDSIIC